MKKFMKEFKEFALKGNVMSLAVGVIIGGAFQSIVTSLTNSFINPLIALVTGGAKTDEAGNPIFVGGKWTINGVDFDYGAFLSAVINFIIMALILFLLIKGMNKLMSIGKKKEEPAAKTTRICPFCQSEISKKACKCPSCTSDVEPEEA
ncbi:MAG: large conductance mechanosensitive channel protein MscL [Lachnospiraceae bacterium]|nr:large conductance mechanosensitive channel protein MscL [Lachnospiraceae bacterium]